MSRPDTEQVVTAWSRLTGNRIAVAYLRIIDQMEGEPRHEAVLSLSRDLPRFFTEVTEIAQATAEALTPPPDPNSPDPIDFLGGPPNAA